MADDGDGDLRKAALSEDDENAALCDDQEVPLDDEVPSPKVVLEKRGSTHSASGGSMLSSETGHEEDDHHHGHHENPRSIVAAIAAAVINFMLMFGLCCAYGMIMFASDHNKEHRALGVKMNLCTAFLAGLTLSWFSGVGVAIGGPDLNPVVFLGGIVEVIAAAIAEEKGLKYPESGRRLGGSSKTEFCMGYHLKAHATECAEYHEELRATTIFAVAVSSAALGSLFFIIGRLKLTRLVRYLPSAITEAFLSCIGYKVFKYALKFCNYEPRQFVPAACVGVPLYFIKALHIGNPAIILPLGLIVPVGVFYGLAYAADPDFDPIKDESMMFPEIPNIDFWHVWTDSIGKYDKININAWSSAGPDLCIMLVVCVLDCVLKISATEEKLPVEVDKDYEISLYGASNLLTTAFGSSVGYMQLKFNVISYGVMHNVGDRRAGTLYALMCGACFFGSIYFFNYLPRFFLSTLLFFAGSGFVAENLWGSRKYLSFFEWLEILVILAVFIIFGKLLYAVGVGVLLCGFGFVRKYASVPVLCGPPLSGFDVDTRERRNPLVQRSINHISGTWLVVLRLKGFIFFGSASTVTGYVKHRIYQDDDNDTPEYRRIRFVCLDCEHLDGLDASAGKAFKKMIDDGTKDGVEFIWSKLPPLVKLELQKREIFSAGDAGVKYFQDLNAAVLHVENLALAYQRDQQQKWLGLHTVFANDQARRSAQMAFEPFRHVFLFDGPRVGCPWCYCQGMNIHNGSVLWRPQEPSSSVFLIHSGAVGVFAKQPETAGDWQTPVAVYRHGWFLNVQALAHAPCNEFAIALEEGQVISWTEDQWRVMAREQPLMMHEIMRSLLKQQSYDAHAATMSADNLHMDMDNHDWEAFEERVEHGAMAQPKLEARTPEKNRTSVELRIGGSLAEELKVDSSRLFSDPSELVDPAKMGVGRKGDWASAGPRQRESLKSNWSTGDILSRGVIHLPHELQIRVPALQSAQALGHLGFYDTNGAVVDIPMPKGLEDNLRTSFQTFCDAGVLSWETACTALMYSGIFETPPPPEFPSDCLSEQDFLTLGQSMLMAKFDEADLKQTQKIFHTYDEDRSGHLDISELFSCFAETIQANVSAEEIESLADAWASEGQGTITEDAFIAIMSRFVRKHRHDWEVLCAFREVLGTENCTDTCVTAPMLGNWVETNKLKLDMDEIEEMLWAACLRRNHSEDAETDGLDFGSFMSVIFAFLGEVKGQLPPPPKSHLRRDAELQVECLVLSRPDEEEKLLGGKAKRNRTAVSHADLGPATLRPGCRVTLHLLLEEPTSSPQAQAVAITMLLLILLSVTILVLEPLASGTDKDKYGDTEKLVWMIMEITFTVIFTTELLLRAIVADALGSTTLCKWLRQPSTLVDIAAILPYFFDLVLDQAGSSLKLLRILRVLRIGRVMRMGRISKVFEQCVSKKQATAMQPVGVVMVVIWGIYMKYSSED